MSIGWKGLVDLANGKFLFECPERNCYQRLTFSNEEDALRFSLNHKCPNQGGETRIGWTVGQTLVEKMWELLDNEVDIIKSDQDQSLKDDAKQRAKAIASCIVIFMEIYFKTTTEVSREALARYNARVAGDTSYTTPGLGSRIYEAAVREANRKFESKAEGWVTTPDGYYTTNPTFAGERKTRQSSRTAASRSASSETIVVKLTDEECNGIRSAYSQMPLVFTPEVLAKQYSVSLAVINSILGL